MRKDTLNPIDELASKLKTIKTAFMVTVIILAFAELATLWGFLSIGQYAEHLERENKVLDENNTNLAASLKTYELQAGK